MALHRRSSNTASATEEQTCNDGEEDVELEFAPDYDAAVEERHSNEDDFGPSSVGSDVLQSSIPR